MFLVPNANYVFLICVWDLLKSEDAFPDVLFLCRLLVLLIVLSWGTEVKIF